MANHSIASAAVTHELRASIEPILQRERITLSEYLRLCLVNLRDNGKPPFEVPEEKRGRALRHGGLKADVKTA
ncbi:hypothetical protein B0G69_1195 [Paraburkholderia sp. RAU2J]|uniref:hypothetical protein n=1 Tax=Paraburkholderia sp. RAU2J TaxID=1938810 RepID=UPI000EB01515|nr:hypothetical protein [Paraburkholderia sp. RAU2J]RKT25479.1 hypothetical protein B0G69_1195 [Paraburkholderia sp. RAU2J]